MTVAKESDIDSIVTDELVALYRERGFVNVPALLTPEEVAEQFADAERQFAERETELWEEEDGLAMDWVADAGLRSEVTRRLALHPKVTAAAEKLAGTPLRLFKSELFRKPAGGLSAPTPIHYDSPSHPFEGRPVTLTAWTALVDVPEERGCMSFIPGSHKEVTPKEGDDGMSPLDRWPHFAWEERVTVPLRAGDVHFHHGRVIHSAGANNTDTTRISLGTVYMDADAVYRPNPVYSYLFPGDDLGGLEPGQPVRGERFPLARSGA
ncbi:phytanoyl-CoA dioxygenase family protein [Nocardiopsis changdeensis]|uniref:Phytanoyl-CoA dioxygenase family protein n=1 Tax=Nocardiopsis changdeensis TaxID=2831969 RepID=A0ABX8BXT2_9ACTN|nr:MULTISPECIES: phytanoyl-CoA dioxygenase family protein [Nocardiopsis]QUX25148.1 phytanoyl-CoA dioxygenase family protein [Nocardiopsis changdeensis]QYX35535.1 phytanoyl-CoA dioxygenase family protein [Nocardiopsis sp. MT53]